MSKKLIYGLISISAILYVTGCGQIIADTLFQEKYVKPATVSRSITSRSATVAMKAAIRAAGKQGWTPKTISAQTNYIFAEQVADAKFTRGARDYTYKLEVRLPDKGNGEASVTVTPPTGVSGKPSEEIAVEFLNELASELAKVSRGGRT